MTTDVRRSLVFLALLLGVAVVAVVFIGPVKTTSEILWQLRVPRVLLGLAVGMGLATAGTIFQGLLRNPLADPFILGTSSGASLGVLLAGLVAAGSPMLLYGSALLCALLSVAVVDRIARTNGKAP